MTCNEVVGIIAKEQWVEQIVGKITDNSKDDTLNDLISDIYLQLLLDDRVPGMYERKQLRFFISRIVMNNIASSTSPYYWTYKRFSKMCEDINGYQY